MRSLLEPGDPARYLAGLQACFGGWGGEGLYDWCFRRRVGGPSPEQLVLTLDDGEWIAGSGVSYRSVVTGTDDALIGIMTGSWTLPAARGRGCFSRIIDESLARVEAHGGAALLAFVTHDNPSRRRLEASGALMAPTAYAVATRGPSGAPAIAWESPEVGAETRDRLTELGERARLPDPHFHYPTGAEWAGQLLDRPLPTSLLSSSDGRRVILERAADTDRLLWYGDEHASTERWAEAVASLAARSELADRKLFCFASRPDRIEACRAMGMDCVDGFLTINPVGDGMIARAWHGWVIDSGDRM